ncbi:hypothetical protein MMC06_003957 [Schaereria dolodes]|nr:hypothetical protein [Schaereria dolodes]
MLSILIARTLITSLIILNLVAAERQIPVCGDAGGVSIYGYPSLNDCAFQLSALDTLTDNRDHFFGLASVTRRPQNPLNYALDVTINEWRNKVQLPIVRRTLVSTPSASTCNLGVFPIELPDQSLSWDTGFYRTIKNDGQSIIANCIRRNHNGISIRGPGGRILTGRYERLALVLYEPGSDWDYQVQSAEAHTQPIYIPLNTLSNPPVSGSTGTTFVTSMSTKITTATPTVTAEPTGPGIKIEPCGPGGHGDPQGMDCGEEGQGSS